MPRTSLKLWGVGAPLARAQNQKTGDREEQDWQLERQYLVTSRILLLVEVLVAEWWAQSQVARLQQINLLLRTSRMTRKAQRGALMLLPSHAESKVAMLGTSHLGTKELPLPHGLLQQSRARHPKVGA
jgi:hypothetical protein